MLVVWITLEFPDLDNPEETKIAREVSPVYQTDKDHPAGFCGAGCE